jgi:hypothetical protein
MFTILQKQLDTIEQIKLNELINDCKGILARDHPEIYDTKRPKDWDFFIKKRFSEAEGFGINDAGNQFIYMLITAQYRTVFTPDIPEWVIEILTWPDMEEDDKIIQLGKEVVKQTT